MVGYSLLPRLLERIKKSEAVIFFIISLCIGVCNTGVDFNGLLLGNLYISFFISGILGTVCLIVIFKEFTTLTHVKGLVFVVFISNSCFGIYIVENLESGSNWFEKGFDLNCMGTSGINFYSKNSKREKSIFLCSEVIILKIWKMEKISK